MFLETTHPGKTKADPFSLESLTAWLETMPADGTYNWGDTGWFGAKGCALIQYYRAKGFRNAHGGASTIRYSRWFWVSEVENPKAFVNVAVSQPHTYGAALERARAARRRS